MWWLGTPSLFGSLGLLCIATGSQVIGFYLLICLVCPGMRAGGWTINFALSSSCYIPMVCGPAGHADPNSTVLGLDVKCANLKTKALYLYMLLSSDSFWPQQSKGLHGCAADRAPVCRTTSTLAPLPTPQRDSFKVCSTVRICRPRSAPINLKSSSVTYLAAYRY